MLEGTVYKAVGGYYFVMTDQGGNYRCYLRGRFRRHKKQVLVGDKVCFIPQDDNAGVIEELEPRRTRLFRPPVANVELAVIIFSLAEPPTNLFLLDRFLLQAEVAGIKPLICFNKSDLAATYPEAEIYDQVGYPVIITSAKTGEGIDQLKEFLRGRVSVFAGPSGVGKSSLLNAVQPGLSLKTGEISSKLKRGRHTTRHAELLRLEFGGLVVDTPGFSSLYLPPELEGITLSNYFPDLQFFAGECRFSGCLHYKEPGCTVKKAALEGKIVASRYEHYLMLLEEVIQQERRQPN